MESGFRNNGSNDIVLELRNTIKITGRIELYKRKKAIPTSGLGKRLKKGIRFWADSSELYMHLLKTGDQYGT